MDKRSLLFMMCCTAGFFAVQAWFGWGQPHPEKVHSQAGEIRKEEEIATRVETANPLPFDSLVAAAQEDGSAGSGLSEDFYVLENDYQQLVFSTRGGALAEINLPLKQGKETKSLIKKIDIDRE